MQAKTPNVITGEITNKRGTVNLKHRIYLQHFLRNLCHFWCSISNYVLIKTANNAVPEQHRVKGGGVYVKVRNVHYEYCFKIPGIFSLLF